MSIDKKIYDTAVYAVGCGTEIKKIELAPRQVSATLCGMYGGSGVEIALYKEDFGYKVTKTLVDEDKFSLGKIGIRGESVTVLNIQ